MKKKSLVLLSKNTGKEFTGATYSTFEYLKRIFSEYEKIIIITKNLGDSMDQLSQQSGNIEIIKFKNVFHAAYLIFLIRKENIFGLSDDHFGFLFKFFKIKYLHIYHGNWPDAIFLSWIFFFKGLIFIPLYLLTLKFASYVVNVSFYMDRFTRLINSSSSVVRNGINHKKVRINMKNKNRVCDILMIGNIDGRKYNDALKLFKLINLKGIDDINFHIYGNIIDRELYKKLNSYNFVNFHGYQPYIEFSNFDVYMSLSKMENLSISLVEALHNNLFVIGYNVGGSNEIVDNFVNGYLAPVGNYKDLYSVLIKFLNSYETINTSKHKLLEFDWELSSQKLFLILKNFTVEKQ
ncbi:glycosyltransferase [Belliella aquatica]|uniref:Glycosyl transferase family 1 domain-containing protein n=1 Tax=Belliella aquatica TaxID=1323734 RepID=A0ABQ1MA77_9BACT|nr:glycosyltransferase [Belliella aquatica]MCH7405691.1 glycosyltransferase [Belliella aquatica]GGC37041.1 hypothetical protein GCM10010993_14860 [Belliella aquatica]